MNKNTFVASAIAFVGLVGFSSTASAAEGDNTPAATAPTPAAAAPANADKTPGEAPERDIKHLSLEINPLAATIGRYSIQAEWMPARHSAFVLNPHFDMVSSDVTSGVNGNTVTYSEKFSGFGGELGYRFYTGSRGPNGFFVGPSFIAGAYTASSDIAGAQSKSFSQIGGAIDIGGQHVFNNGILIGAGFGLQYTKVSEDFKDLPLTAGIIAGGGVRPRFLLSLGYAFL